MKVYELITKLQQILNQDAEVYMEFISVDMNSGNMSVNLSQANDLIVPNDGNFSFVTISTGTIEKEL
jgi:ABC-type phosphate transport system auxiliary subunit